VSSELHEVLDRARTLGFLGPGPVRAHVEHAEIYLPAIPDDAARLLDLGSGGGVPGLVLLVARPSLTAVLLDASSKRGAFLTWAVSELGIAGRAEVAIGRAEELARSASLRAGFDTLVSRGFGPPAATLENARGFVADGGRIIVSEPPERRVWPSEALADLGLEELDPLPGVASFVVIGPVADRWPRPLRNQQRSPLF
jgi:16S rRNA (guanine527-N7)-methyltransferase